jgi:DNA-binding NarL/FixJ family response regulator
MGTAGSAERMSTRPRVLLADDHRMFAEGLRTLLGEEFELVDIVGDGVEMLEAALRLLPDVIVADITMPRLNGIDALTQLRAVQPDARVVFLTMHLDATYARRALAAGALGFVLKHSAVEELVLALRSALAGQIFVTPLLGGDVLAGDPADPARRTAPFAALTPRQREVLQLLADGKSVKQVASMLSISTRTVEFHKYTMMETVGAKGMADLVRIAIRNGLVSD